MSARWIISGRHEWRPYKIGPGCGCAFMRTAIYDNKLNAIIPTMAPVVPRIVSISVGLQRLAFGGTGEAAKQPETGIIDVADNNRAAADADRQRRQLRTAVMQRFNHRHHQPDGG